MGIMHFLMKFEILNSFEKFSLVKRIYFTSSSHKKPNNLIMQHYDYFSLSKGYFPEFCANYGISQLITNFPERVFGSRSIFFVPVLSITQNLFRNCSRKNHLWNFACCRFECYYSFIVVISRCFEGFRIYLERKSNTFVKDLSNHNYPLKFVENSNPFIRNLI